MLAFVKHGKTEGDEKIKGHLPVPLSDIGREQTKGMAEALKNTNIPFSIIFTSDLVRAVQTAEIISQIINLPVKQMEVLRERSAGIAEGKFDKDVDWLAYEKNDLETRSHEGGESLQDVQKRAKIFLETIQDVHAIIVSHEAFIKMALSVVNKLQIKDAVKLNIENNIVVVDLKKESTNFIPYSV